MSKPPFRGTILRNQRRKNIETLIAISSNLDEGDRMIIEQVFRQGRPLTELAVVLNCSNRALQYRLKKMMKRLSNKDFRFLLHHSHQLDPLTRKVAIHCVMRSASYRDTANRLGISIHEVRTHIKQFKDKVRNFQPPAEPLG